MRILVEKETARLSALSITIEQMDLLEQFIRLEPVWIAMTWQPWSNRTLIFTCKSLLHQET